MKPFNLTLRGPKAAAVVSQPAFDRLKALAPAEVTIRVEGKVVDIGQFSGSDHLAFARAGVPATHIASSTGKAHTPQDTAHNVSDAALARAGRFVLAVAEKVK